jgi:hypothetical protein
MINAALVFSCLYMNSILESISFYLSLFSLPKKIKCNKFTFFLGTQFVQEEIRVFQKYYLI